MRAPRPAIQPVRSKGTRRHTPKHPPRQAEKAKTVKRTLKPIK